MKIIDVIQVFANIAGNFSGKFPEQLNFRKIYNPVYNINNTHTNCPQTNGIVKRLKWFKALQLYEKVNQSTVKAHN